MLRLVEDKDDKVAAQREFVRNLSAAWPRREKRLVVWRPSSKILGLVTNGHYWFAPPKIPESKCFWNAFGEYVGNNNLPIAVEINIPVSVDDRRIAGFFAYDDISRATYIMHDGGVGGGRKGIGRDNYLWWSSAQPTEVLSSDGRCRHGVIVTGTADRDIGSNVEKFIRSVADFKRAVTSGDLSTVAAQKAAKSYSDYFREFSGTKRGARAREFEYISRHGDIVHALSEWRKSNQKPSTSERIVKNAYIDLGVESGAGLLAELYEVKTSGDRQSIYTAIGQLTVHSTSSPDVNRFIVLPHGSQLAADIQLALREQSIRVLHFRIDGQRVSIY